MSELIKNLNEKQKQAVLQTEGPVLILAGAGSGKTRALTYRVAYLVREKKIAPKNVLAVTFTNKAAGEMMGRIKELLNLPENTPPFSRNLPHVGTFHSICVRILRQEIEKFGFSKSFVIYDDQDQLALIKRVMKELEIPQEQIKPKAILGAISSAKNDLIDARQFENQVGSYFEEAVAKCYKRYASELKKSDAVDFDDIIMLTVKIFQQDDKILEKYQTLFKYIMVDEYQDTNHAQYLLLKMLAAGHRNICVVGDDFQAIYGWRNADIRNILDFEKDYPEAKIFLLEQNYRSTQNILNAAHCVISKNKNQKEKKLWTDNVLGELLGTLECPDEKAEADFVASEIEKNKDEKGVKLTDFAVLYRTNAQSRALEEAFMKRGLPYKIIGGLKFYQRKEVKDVLAYLYFMQNPSDKVNFERIVNFPARGIGKTTVTRLIEASNANGINMLEVIRTIEGLNIKITPAKVKELQKFAQIIKKGAKLRQTASVFEVIEFIYQFSGYEVTLAKEGEEGQVRHENVMELLTVAKKYTEEEGGMEKFLEDVALISQADKDLEIQDAVPFMTLHSSKGLEFETVFLVGMEEGILPHSRAFINKKEMEEERRLCYVGITRARQKAFMIFTATRNIYGSTQISVKSRFLDEIDNELIEETYAEFSESGSGITGGSFYSEKTISFDDDSNPLKVETDFKDGSQVKHPEFGRGVVISQDDNLVTVAFPKVGLKKMAKGIAPLEKI
jgi:DNA helicase-2/ATP-dependent DNA helicase PcrA